VTYLTEKNFAIYRHALDGKQALVDEDRSLSAEDWSKACEGKLCPAYQELANGKTVALSEVTLPPPGDEDIQGNRDGFELELSVRDSPRLL